MPKATSSNITTAPPILSGSTAISIADTIARLKQIAMVAQDHLYLSDGPANPDYELLGVCAEGLHFGRETRRLEKLRSDEFDKPTTERVYDTCELYKQMQEAEAQFRGFCHKARKLSAKTPAGLFAKAIFAARTRLARES
jgi:hypothetical protein